MLFRSRAQGDLRSQEQMTVPRSHTACTIYHFCSSVQCSRWSENEHTKNATRTRIPTMRRHVMHTHIHPATHTHTQTIHTKKHAHAYHQPAPQTKEPLSPCLSELISIQSGVSNSLTYITESLNFSIYSLPCGKEEPYTLGWPPDTQVHTLPQHKCGGVCSCACVSLCVSL